MGSRAGRGVVAAPDAQPIDDPVHRSCRSNLFTGRCYRLSRGFQLTPNGPMFSSRTPWVSQLMESAQCPQSDLSTRSRGSPPNWTKSRTFMAGTQ